MHSYTLTMSMKLKNGPKKCEKNKMDCDSLFILIKHQKQII